MSNRTRAVIECFLAGLALVGAVVTAIFPTWFEALFESSPDSGSGALEWTVVLILAVAFLLFAILARRDFRIARTWAQGQTGTA